MRAVAAGWRHVLDDSCFVFHEGQRSFGASRSRRVEAAHRAMRRLHPDYIGRIARFIAEDPLAPARRRVTDALAHRRRRDSAPVERVVHLVHGWPPFDRAGTELYAHWLVLRQLANREVGVYARIAEPDRSLGDAKERDEFGVRVRLAVNNFAQRDPLSRNALYDRRLGRDFDRFLADQRPQLIHVHHLAGHSATLLQVAARREVPIVFQVQDWWPICARTNLLDRSGRLCSGPTPHKCSQCLPMTALPGATVWNPLLYAARRQLMRRLLRLPTIFVMGSKFIAESYRDHRMLPSNADIRVLPYGVPTEERSASQRRRPEARHPIRFGYIGSIQPHKGAHLAAEAFADVDPAEARLQIWGDATANPDYARSLRACGRPAIELCGSFPEDRKRGALAEILTGTRRPGAFFDPEDVGELRDWIHRIIERPAIADAWSRDIAPPKDMDEHALEIDAVYSDALASWRQRGRGAAAKR